MVEREATIGAIIGSELRHQLRQFGREVSLEKGKIWDLRERELVYRGVKGRICSYFDGVNDYLVFVDFPPGPEWDKLKRSIQSLKRNTNRGRYKVKAKDKAERAQIRLPYSDRDYPRNFNPARRFARIWQDFEKFLPQRPGLVEKSRARAIKEFILQDLLVED